LEETAELLQAACRVLGIPAPGRVAGKKTTTALDGMQKLDEWLHAVGARLVAIDVDSDDVLVAPVLAADHETFADRDSDTVRLRSVEQFVAHSS
ncbi:MAG TPA: hypothetical protein H9830_03880, partial [Candidatus Agrococcus pullicola]|nr:hypothetical protein [Candidatus Agrococcus pullicola]